MKFRYYIIDEDGEVACGTNDRNKAVEATEYFAVLDAEEGKMLPWADGDTRTEEQRTVKELTE